MRKSLRCPEWLAVTVLAVLLSSCDDSDPTEILGNEVDRAYEAWQDLGATDYRFEISSVSVFLSSHHEVTVEDGRAVSGGFTIDVLWLWILAAHDRGELHHASFDPRGVPDLVDFGDWDVDGGVIHRISNFELR